MPDPVLRIQVALDLSSYFEGLNAARAAQDQFVGQLTGIQAGLTQVESASRAAGATADTSWRQAAAAAQAASEQTTAAATASSAQVQAANQQVAQTASAAAEETTGAWAASNARMSEGLAALATEAQTDWASIGNTAAAQNGIATVTGQIDRLQQQIADLGATHPDIVIQSNLPQVEAQAAELKTFLAELSAGVAAGTVSTQEYGAQMKIAQGELAGMSGAVQGAQSDVKALEGATNTANEGMNLSFGKVLGAVYAVQLGFQFVKGTVDATVGSFGTYQTELLNIQANTGQTTAQTEAMGDSIRATGDAGGLAFDKVGLGYEHIANFSFDAASQVKIATDAMQASVATGGDFATISDLVASSLHQEALSADQAANVTSAYMTAARLANATFADFADHMGRAISLGSVYHISLVDIASAESALTRSGMDSAQSQSALDDILSHIAHPTAQATAAIADLSQKTGWDLTRSMSAAGLESQGLNGVLSTLKDSMTSVGMSEEQQTQALGEMMPGLRGGNALLAIMTHSWNDYKTAQTDVSAAYKDGTVQQDAFNRSSQSVDVQVGILRQHFEDLKLSIGEAIAPLALFATQGADDIAVYLNALIQTGSQEQALIALGKNVAQQQGDAWKASAAAASAAASETADLQNAVAARGVQLTQEQAQQESDTWNRSYNENVTAATKAEQAIQDTWATGLEKIAQETTGKSPRLAQGLLDAEKLLETGIPKGFEAAGAAIQAEFAKMNSGVAISAQELHDQVMAPIERIANDVNNPLHLAMQNILDILHAAEAPAAITGADTGDLYLNSLIDQTTGALPDLAHAVGLLLDTMGGDKAQNAAALLGGDVGERYRIDLLAKMGSANLEAATIADQAAAAFVHQAGAAGNTQEQEQSYMRQAQAQRELAQSFRDTGAAAVKSAYDQAGAERLLTPPTEPKLPKTPKGPKGPADPGKQMAQTLESIVKALQQADQDSQGPSASLAKSIEDVLVVAREKVPADAQWIQASLDGLIAKYQAHQLSTEQYNKAVSGILGTLAKGHGDIAIAAQAALDTVAAANQKATTAADDKADRISAAALKEQLSVVNSAAQMAEAASKSSTTQGDSQVALLGILETATKDKLPALTDFATGEWDKMQSSAGLSNQQLHDDTIAYFQDMADKTTGITHAQYVAQLAEIQDGDKQIADAQAKAAQQQHELQVAFSGGFGNVLKDVTAATVDLPKTVSDILALAKQAQDAGLATQAAALRHDAQLMWAGGEDGYRQGAANIMAILQQSGQSQDLQVQANLAQELTDYKAGLQAIADAQQQAQVSLAGGLGSAGTATAGGSASIADQVLSAITLAKQAEKAGMAELGAQITADAKAALAGVPGALAQLNTDEIAALQRLVANADPEIAATAQKALAAIQAAADKAGTDTEAVYQKMAKDAAAAAAAIAQTQQGLATSLASLGKDILSGKDSPLQALIALGPLAAQAAASTDPALQAIGAQMQAMIAHGASLSDILALVAQAEAQLVASGNPLAALMAQQAEAELQAAAASAQYAAQIKGLQATLKSEQADLAAINDALKSQQDHLKELQDGYSKAQTALQNYGQAKLAGEAANTAAGQALKGGSDLLNLAQSDLSQTGGNAAQAQALLQQQYQAILAQHQAAEQALQGQIGSTSDPTQKAALQKQLEQLQAVDAQLQQSFSTALGALGSSDPTKGLQDGLKALQDRMQQLALTGSLTFDPLKVAIAGLVDPAKDAELSFGGIVGGIDKNRDAMSKLTPQIAAVQKAIADLQGQQAAEQKTIADTNTAIATAQQAMSDLASGTATAMGQIKNNVQGGLSSVASTVALHANQNETGTIAAAWGGQKGVLTYMLSKLGGTGSLTGDAPGNAGSFVPNVYESFNDLVTNLIPDAMSGMLDVVATWGSQMNSMKDATHAAVVAEIADFQALINKAQEAAKYAPPGGSTPPDQGKAGDTFTRNSAYQPVTTREAGARTLELTIHHYDRYGRRTDTQRELIELRHQNVAQGLPA